jgi:hypothetical protein
MGVFGQTCSLVPFTSVTLHSDVKITRSITGYSRWARALFVMQSIGSHLTQDEEALAETVCSIV